MVQLKPHQGNKKRWSTFYLNTLQHFRRIKKKFLFKLKKVRFEISFSDRFVTEAIV